MTLIFAGASLVISFVLAVHGLFLSHKIAGPLYRLRVHMEAVSKGETQERVRFRKNDQFKELEEAYNKQLDYLSRVQTSTNKPKDRRKVA